MADTDVSATINRPRRVVGIERRFDGDYAVIIAVRQGTDGSEIARETWRVRASDRHVFSPHTGLDTGYVMGGSIAAAAVALFASLDTLVGDLGSQGRFPAPV